jgi:uncharacterized membrane protein
MPDHHARISIAAPAADVFAFLANPLNLPRWQPSLREAFRENESGIRVIGGGVGAQGVAAHARFLVDHDARRLCWAAEAGIGCAGDVTVTETPEGTEVALDLRLGPRAERPEAVHRWTGDPALDIEAAIRASLEAVRRHCEGVVQGVTLVSGGSQADPARAPLRDSRAYGTSVEPDQG